MTRPPSVERPPPRRRSGVTLLEVLLALLIFSIAFAIVSQLYDSGRRAAVRSRLETEAVLRCESKLAEIAAGLTPPAAQGETAFDDAPNWTWSCQTTAGPAVDLLQVTVSVAHAGSNNTTRVRVELTRLLRDPVVLLDRAAEAAAQEEESSSSSTTP